MGLFIIFIFVVSIIVHIQTILIFVVPVTYFTHIGLAVTGVKILDVALDVVMFDHFATQDALKTPLHPSYQRLWKMLSSII